MLPSDAAWQQKLAALHAHVAEHGRLPPHGDASGLGAWVSDQRQGKKATDAGRKSNTKMTPERAAALEGVPGWAWELGHDAAWEQSFAGLRSYVGAHGSLPHWKHPSGLGKWVHNQRRAKKAMEAGSKSKSMTPARATALEAVPGWAWVGRRRATAAAAPPAKRARKAGL